MKPKIFILLFIMCSTLLFAQTKTGRPNSNTDKNTTYILTINSGASSYTVWVDNQRIKGNITKVSSGNHTVVVKAPGYADWSQTVNVNKNMTLNVNMTTNQHRLSIQTNTSSSIYINDRMVGNNSYSGALDPGTYSVVVRSNGFMDYKATVVLDRDTNLVANLQPLTASVSIYIPPELLNNKIGGAMNQVKIYDNGKFVNAFNLQLTPGNHTIRIESGGFAIEGNYNFEAGRTYNIEPVMFLNIK